jgi:hypothetical protein
MVYRALLIEYTTSNILFRLLQEEETSDNNSNGHIHGYENNHDIGDESNISGDSYFVHIYKLAHPHGAEIREQKREQINIKSRKSFFYQTNIPCLTDMEC